jgi:hypothetical protein
VSTRCIRATSVVAAGPPLVGLIILRIDATWDDAGTVAGPGTLQRTAHDCQATGTSASTKRGMSPGGPECEPQDRDLTTKSGRVRQFRLISRPEIVGDVVERSPRRLVVRWKGTGVTIDHGLGAIPPTLKAVWAPETPFHADQSPLRATHVAIAISTKPNRRHGNSLRKLPELTIPTIEYTVNAGPVRG